MRVSYVGVGCGCVKLVVRVLLNAGCCCVMFVVSRRLSLVVCCGSRLLPLRCWSLFGVVCWLWCAVVCCLSMMSADLFCCWCCCMQVLFGVVRHVVAVCWCLLCVARWCLRFDVFCLCLALLLYVGVAVCLLLCVGCCRYWCRL